MKLQSQLPKGEPNGLGEIEAALVRNPKGMHVVIAVVDAKQIIADADTGMVEPTVRIRRVEVIGKEDAREAERLLRRALERRQGDTVLPLEIEDEIAEIFENLDRETGEIRSEDGDAD